jgi:GNAT superfamily N-acetyltransferase
MVYQSETLHERHRLAAFDCGKPEMNLWLHNSARHAQAMRTSTTFVWHDGDDVALAYFGLAAHLIQREQLPAKVGRGSPDQIPAVLIARLALDVQLRGQGLGVYLLIDAYRRIQAAAENVAVRFVVVEAIDEQAKKFYLDHQFIETPVEGRLVRKVSDIAADLAS